MDLPEKRILISELCTVLETYMNKSQVEKVYRAYMMAASAHDGQYRKSGEAYVFHPINVAMVLAELKLDCFCIIAALLHDCIEDTTMTQVDIVRDFGKEVAHIVEGVSKLTDLEVNSKVEKQAQNFRKLLLAMSVDMRVMMIKLADRLHNMRTLQSVRREQQLRIAKETSEIYTPIARRLGLNGIRTELERLCFKFIHPYRCQVLNHQVDKRYGGFKEIIVQIQEGIKQRFTQEGIPGVAITGRKKETYSVYKKMKNKHLKFSEVLDVYGFRVVLEDAAHCYQALGVVHNLYKPLPGKFKDYIALPKSNGYQSLHTVLFGPGNMFIEVQIRSKEMDFISEYGIAAHWHYKSEKNDPSELANNWMGSLLNIQQNSDTSVEFLEEAKVDLFPSEVFVFTPKGDIIQLPYGSTALDFAYAIHTKVGNHTHQIKIDKVKKPLSVVLKSGQTIDVITRIESKPNIDWLKKSITAKARSSIKTKLKEDSVAELIQLGGYTLSNALDYQGDGTPVSEAQWSACLIDLKCSDKEDLYIKIALSEILVSFVLKTIQGKTDGAAKNIILKTTKNKPISFARCCYPVPGDKVAGMLSSKGLVVHRAACNNFMRAKNKGEQWLDIDWQADEGEEFEVLICVDIENRRGMLASVANAIAKMNVNIEHLKIEEHNQSMKAMNLVVSVKNKDVLDEVMYNIKALEFVHTVARNNYNKKP